MPPTATAQRNAVSEGTALGLLLAGRNSLTYDKLRIDLSFAGAWRTWPYRTRFPQVNTDLAHGLDGVHVLTRATGNKKVWVLFWEQEGPDWVIRARQPDWHPSNPDDVDFAVGLIDGEVPSDGWHDLAADFLHRFER